MKPGSRSEFNLEQDVPEVERGHAEADTPSDHADVAAVLWVPDPEQRHGWREVYVRRTAPQSRHRMGFRR